MGGSCTRGNNWKIWSLCIETDCDTAACDISNHHRNKEWRNMFRTALCKFIALFCNGVDATSTRTNINAQTFCIDIFAGFKSCIFHRLNCCCQRILSKQICFSYLRFFNIFSRLKVLNFCRYFYLLFGGIKTGDHADTVFSFCQIVPEAFQIVSNRRNNAHTGYYYSSHLCPSCVDYRFLTYSIRRQCTVPDR